MGKKSKKEKYYVGDKIIDEIWRMGLGLYLVAVLFILPIYIYDHYWDMAWHKWKIYLNGTCVVLIFSACMLTIGGIYKTFCKNSISAESPGKSIADRTMLIYSILVVLSFITCPNKAAAWMGTEGWYMGVIPQLLMIAVYFLFSRREVSTEVLLGLHGTASAFCYLYAICQRLGNDWLHLYWDMPAEIVRDYLSTIGNRTWFSAYICTAFPIGVYFFWYAKKSWMRWVAGGYMFLAFQCMVVVNSDSIYMGLIAVFYVLGLLSIGNPGKGKRLLEVALVWFGACITMVVLREIIPQFPRDARGISKVFMNGATVFSCFFVLLVIWLVLSLRDGTVKCKKFSLQKRRIAVSSSEKVKKTRILILAGTGVLVVLVVVFIYCNTAGILQKAFGVTVNNQYLLFDDNWGDYRGHTWKMTLHMFAELPLVQKLFGAGADCFAYTAYSNSEYSQVLQNFWGDTILANAHNEWLNQLFCFGILGGLAYLGVFLAVAYECLWNIDTDKEHPLIPAIGLCVLAYMAHNFFCYQQVCATPVMFLLMGVAVHLKKRYK